MKPSNHINLGAIAMIVCCAGIAFFVVGIAYRAVVQ